MPHALRHAFVLASHDQNRGTGQIQFGKCLRGVSVEAHDTDARISRSEQGLSDRADTAELRMLDRPSRGSEGRRGKRGSSVLAEHHGGSSDRYRGANDRSKVLRVLDLIQGNGQEVGIDDAAFPIREGQGRCVGDDSLVFDPARDPIELTAIETQHLGHPLIPRKAFECVQSRQRAIVDADAQYRRTMYPNRFANGLQSEDQSGMVEGSGHAPAISATICAATAAGSAASRMGLPTTKTLEPD